MIELATLMNPWIVTAVSFVLLSVLLLAYLAYSGLFTQIQVSAREPVYGELTICYKTGRGPYKNTGELFEECRKFAPNRMLMGLYYDDPESVAEEELRFAVGVVVAENNELPDSNITSKMMEAGYKLAFLPKPYFAVITTFPCRTKLSLYIAIYKVYPLLKDYIYSRGLCAYPAIEIYSNSEIMFMMPLSRQEEFFVPEFSDDLISNATTEVSSVLDRSSTIRTFDDDHHRQNVVGEGPSSSKREGSQTFFVKPEAPPPLRRSPRNPKPETSTHDAEDSADHNDDDTSSTSSFEDLAKEASEPAAAAVEEHHHEEVLPASPDNN